MNAFAITSMHSKHSQHFARPYFRHQTRVQRNWLPKTSRSIDMPWIFLSPYMMQIMLIYNAAVQKEWKKRREGNHKRAKKKENQAQSINFREHSARAQSAADDCIKCVQFSVFLPPIMMMMMRIWVDEKRRSFD